MGLEEQGWPGSRWRLTAPESYVLIYGPEAGGSRPFKLALMELVAGKCLTLTDTEDSALFGLWKRRVALLSPGPEYRSPRSRSLSALLDLLGETSPRTTRDGNTGVPIPKLARKARRKYGWLGGYAESEVIPGLASRGLYERRERTVARPSGISYWKLTRAGEAARAEFERNLGLAEKRLSLWVDEDPARALAFLGATGFSVSLVEQLHLDIPGLNERHAGGGPYLHPGFEGGFDHDEPGATLNGLDALNLDASGFDASNFGDTFDRLNGAFSAIDSGAGAGGGGDGGGGT